MLCNWTFWRKQLRQNISRFQSHLAYTRPPAMLFVVLFSVVQISSPKVFWGFLTWFSFRSRAWSCKSTDHVRRPLFDLLSFCFCPNFSLIMPLRVKRFHSFLEFSFQQNVRIFLPPIFLWTLHQRVLLTDRPGFKVKIENNLNLVCTFKVSLNTLFSGWNFWKVKVFWSGPVSVWLEFLKNEDFPGAPLISSDGVGPSLFSWTKQEDYRDNHHLHCR